MKKLLSIGLSVLMVMALMSALVGCGGNGDGDTDEGYSLVGMWESEDVSMRLDADGTGTFFMMEVLEFDLEWSVSGDELTLIIDDGDPMTDEFTLTATTLEFNDNTFTRS